MEKTSQSENRVVYSSKTDDFEESPFAVLKSFIQEETLGSDSQIPPQDDPMKPATAVSVTSEFQVLIGKKIIVSKSRAGRSGKTITILECRDTKSEDLNKILNILKNRMGCGGLIEENAQHHLQILLQGDLRERLRNFLNSQGVSVITIGN